MEAPEAGLTQMSPSEKRQYRLQRETHLLEDVVKCKTERLVILKAENDRLRQKLRGKIERAYNALGTATNKTPDQGAASTENGSETTGQGQVTIHNSGDETISSHWASLGGIHLSEFARNLLDPTGIYGPSS
ncbi:uncharacterized protein [Palaemon carinicauda]|uniref:uncharacterized protein n=1 Tax=Palaemon carinicauda TaxID=392227 RepID=UPI0035B66076